MSRAPVIARYPDAWLEGPARMIEKTEKLLAAHERHQDRRPQVLGIVAAARRVVQSATDVSAHQRIAWLARLAAIENLVLDQRPAS